MRQLSPTQDEFFKDVATHELKIEMDNRMYRHLKFNRPGTSTYHFGLITWPGYLCYYGDMGSYVFSRLPDMFEFFRTDRGRMVEPINPSYWAEKCLAIDRNDGIKEFSPDRLKAWGLERVQEWIDDAKANDRPLTPEQEVSLRERLWEDVLALHPDGIHAVMDGLSQFSVIINGDDYRVDDYWELAPAFEDYTFRYIWCCRAIAWGIQKYDEAKAGAGVSA